jgi:amino acid transporter
MTLFPMIAATYFMVAGGPFGLEDIVGAAGYGGALLIIFLTPILWSIPTALMVSELGSAIPEEGGFYVWVRRALGPFWGFQEAWLSLAGSFFDMALYPALFVAYVGTLFPSLATGAAPILLGLGMIAVCTGWNILGARAVGRSSVVLAIVLLGPFAVLTVIALLHSGPATGPPVPLARVDILGGILVAMWNFMGWDNLSTIAKEVDRPQKTFPLAMLGAVSLVIATYAAPIAAVSLTEISSDGWTTGGWVHIAETLGGTVLAVAVTLGGVIGAVGTFTALMMSLSRLPVAMAEDGFLPDVFRKVHPRTGAPWVAIVSCAVFWALFFPLGFESLVVIDVLLTGLSILLEFVALVALRIKEPNLPRPYKIPGGLVVAIAIGVPPAALVAVSVVRNSSETLGPVNGLVAALGLVAVGPVLYLATKIFGSGRAGRFTA